MKRIALLGFGTVGSGVYEVIEKSKEMVKERFGMDIDVVSILVRNTEKYAHHPFHHKFTESFDDLLAKKPHIAIEVMGGLEPGFTYITHLLKEGVDVVTANKDLIAEHGQVLLTLAKDQQRTLLYEASVGGGIPILKPLQECLGGNEINSIAAVINGTTNFILSKMTSDSMAYEEALALAQKKGFAEADPTSDVMGHDAIRKLAILSRLAYGQQIEWDSLPAMGITDVQPEDIACAKSIGSTIKLVAYSEYNDKHLYAGVRPMVVHKANPIASIDNEYNAVVLTGDAVGELMFTGKGAGKMPTASAVFGDVIDIIQNRKEHQQNALRQDAVLHTQWYKPGKWLVRVVGRNKSEIIHALLKAFAGEEIRIQASHRDDQVHGLVRTQNEGELLDKLASIKDLDTIYKTKHYLVYQ